MSELKKSPIIVLLLANLAFSSFIAFNMLKQQNTHAEASKSNQQNESTQPDKVSSTDASSNAPERNLQKSTVSIDRNAETSAKKADESSAAKVATKVKNHSLKISENSQVYHDPAEPSSEDINAVLSMASRQSVRTVKSTKPLRPVSDVMASSRPMRMSVPPPPDTSIFNGAPSLSKMDGITVTAVMGNRAMLKLERPGRRHRHGVPEVVCLAVGEHIRTPYNVSVAIVAVEPYRVTLDIDGDRFVKSLTEIR